MKLTSKIEKALNLAAQKHDCQIRKSSKSPFIIHPVSVMIILSQYTEDENILVASLLHDILEDVEDYNYKDLKKDFGEKIAQIVEGVSEDPDLIANRLDDKKTWQSRKERYIKTLKKDSFESLMICAADKIHNLRSMTKIYQEQGEKMWQDFNAPLEKQVWYYQAVTRILKEKLNNSIIKELEREFIKFEKMFIKNKSN
jgi:(p)ppGpp synthase/HD superfamily hydrolase